MSDKTVEQKAASYEANKYASSGSGHLYHTRVAAYLAGHAEGRREALEFILDRLTTFKPPYTFPGFIDLIEKELKA